jgi:hypothetical protein
MIQNFHFSGKGRFATIGSYYDDERGTYFTERDSKGFRCGKEFFSILFIDLETYFLGDNGNPLVNSAFFEIIFYFDTIATRLSVVVDVGIVVDFLNCRGSHFLLSKGSSRCKEKSCKEGEYS